MTQNPSEIAFLSEIEEATREARLVFGLKEILKSLKSEKVKFLVVSRTCKPDIADKIARSSKRLKIPLYNFEGSSSSLGRLCGKPFNISVASIILPKEEEIDFEAYETKAPPKVEPSKEAALKDEETKKEEPTEKTEKPKKSKPSKAKKE